MEYKTQKENIDKLSKLIKGINIAMLTTVDEDGSLRSRPMATQQVEFDSDLWFFVSNDSPKVDEIESQHAVNVSYAAPNENRYVSVSGMAILVYDRAKMEDLWNPIHKIWFPDGLDDPKLALLKVEVQKAEYWDAPGGVIETLVGFARAIASGDGNKMAENEKIRLS